MNLYSNENFSQLSNGQWMYYVGPGAYFPKCAKLIADFSNAHGVSVDFRFDGIDFTAPPNSTEAEVNKILDDRLESDRLAWLTSDEGIAKMIEFKKDFDQYVENVRGCLSSERVNSLASPHEVMLWVSEIQKNAERCSTLNGHIHDRPLIDLLSQDEIACYCQGLGKAILKRYPSDLIDELTDMKKYSDFGAHLSKDYYKSVGYDSKMWGEDRTLYEKAAMTGKEDVISLIASVLRASAVKGEILFRGGYDSDSLSLYLMMTHKGSDFQWLSANVNNGCDVKPHKI